MGAVQSARVLLAQALTMQRREKKRRNKTECQKMQQQREKSPPFVASRKVMSNGSRSRAEKEEEEYSKEVSSGSSLLFVLSFFLQLPSVRIISQRSSNKKARLPFIFFLLLYIYETVQHCTSRHSSRSRRHISIQILEVSLSLFLRYICLQQGVPTRSSTTCDGKKEKRYNCEFLSSRCHFETNGSETFRQQANLPFYAGFD